MLAAARYLKKHGVKTVSVVGGSFGGVAAGDATIKSVHGGIDSIAFLGAAPNLPSLYGSSKITGQCLGQGAASGE